MSKEEVDWNVGIWIDDSTLNVFSGTHGGRKVCEIEFDEPECSTQCVQLTKPQTLALIARLTEIAGEME